MASLTIIICTWNRADSLRATLQSIERQERCHFDAVEVIVVDNNSKDQTANMVAQTSTDWKLGKLRYIFEPRQGKQFALNTGIVQSSGELLAFTDDDIVLPPNWLASIYSAFADTFVEVAGGKTLLTWPECGQPTWYSPSMAAVLGGVDLGEKALLPPPEGYAPAGANLVARRALFDEVGLFSETHFRHMDYEFGLRCAQKGSALAYIPSIVVSAPVDAAMLSKRYFRRWSFKAGISHQGNSKPAPVPRWLVRRLAQDLAQWPLAQLFRPRSDAFALELRIWRGFGTVCSWWQARTKPDRYAEWVERYSQKKKNLY